MKDYPIFFAIGLILGLLTSTFVVTYFNMHKKPYENDGRYNMSRHERITQHYEQLMKTETEAR